MESGESAPPFFTAESLDLASRMEFEEMPNGTCRVRIVRKHTVEGTFYLDPRECHLLGVRLYRWPDFKEEVPDAR